MFKALPEIVGNFVLFSSQNRFDNLKIKLKLANQTMILKIKYSGIIQSKYLLP